MREPRWLTLQFVVSIQADQVRDHGGSLGLRDRGLLESALDRPRNRFHHEPEADVSELAAAYGFGISKNHPFIDGNKRVAYQAMYLFLGLNGFRIDALEEEVVTLILALASGNLEEAELVSWLRDHIVQR